MEPGKYYHVITHAVGSENLFRSSENYRYFLERYYHYTNAVCETLAYCLMPNHVHFLIKIKNQSMLTEAWQEKFPENDDATPGDDILSIFVIRRFAHLLNGYTQAYNKMYKRRGTLFIHPFKRIEIRDDDSLTRVIVYIHANPVRHGFVKKISNWDWSSYQQMLGDDSVAFRREAVLDWFGNRETFVSMHERLGFKETSADWDSE